MALETGVVLKTSGSRCMVLTPQGEFRTVPRTQGTVSVGQEIQFAWPAAQTQWRLLLAAASLFVILMAGTLFASIFPAAGYVSVDINPSIELGMNAWGRVVRAQGLNGDGQNLLQSLPLYGRPLDQALDNIAQKAVAMHYLKQGDQNNLMMITYTPGRLALAQLRREDAYQALAAQLKAEQTPAKLLFADMTPAQRHQAQQMGLSAGKYLVWERLMNRGVNISAQQMAQTSIAKLLLAEKMQVDAIMGPNTTYREVQPEGIASSGRTGSGMSPAGRTGAGITSSGRTGSGMAVKPGARVVPAMPSRQQGASKRTAAKTSQFSSWMQRLRERLWGGGSNSSHSDNSGDSDSSRSSTMSGGPENYPENQGQPAGQKMAPSGAGTGSQTMP